MMRLKPILFFLVVGSFAVYVAARQYQYGDGGVIRIGQIAPDFTAQTADGKTVKLSDYRGKLVFLNFWASWCEPCAVEMPDLEILNKTYRDKRFQMLTFSVDTDQDAAAKFYNRFKLTMPWFPDPGQVVAGRYKVTGFPETFLIDRNGHIVKHYVGAISTQIMAQLDSYIGDQGTADGPTQ
jgi:peroxiredoxin